MSRGTLLGRAARQTAARSVPGLAQSYDQRILSQSPLHYWRLAGDLTDAGSSAIALANVNGVPLSGRPALVVDANSGGSGSFSAGSSPGHLTATGALDGLQAMTVHLVVQPDQLAAKHILLNLEDGQAVFSDALGIELVDNGDGALTPRVYRWTGTEALIMRGAGGVTVPSSSPLHLDVAFLTNGTIAVYVDGEIVGMTVTSGASAGSWPAISTGSKAYLGCYKDGVGAPFNGLMAEAAIFAGALDAGTIFALSQPARKVDQAVYLADFDAGTLSGTGLIDPAAQPTTHPTTGLAAIADTDPAGIIVGANGVWHYDVTEIDDGATSFTGHVSVGAVDSAVVTISGTVSNSAGAGGALSIPSFAEWLISDEETPGATLYVSGQNRGNGSGSSAANAKEVQAALNGASPGAILVAVCQTAGAIEFWDYPNGLVFPGGTSGNPITLQARQGDGVVISAGEAFAGARTPNSGFWELSPVSGDSAKKIWRSTSTFPGGADNMMGWWVEFDHPHQIVRANSMANLRAPYDSGDSKPDGSGDYAGPCIHKDGDGHIYLRFQRPHPDKYSAGGTWSRNVWPAHPEAVNDGGQLVYPISEDPNDYPIYITPDVNLSDGRTAFRLSSASGGWIKVGSGINSVGYRICAEGHDVAMRRGLHWSWQAAFTSSSQTNQRFNFDVQRARFTDGSKIHLARADWKFGGWLEVLRSVFLGSPDANSMHDLYFKDVSIADYHELVVLNRFNERIRFRNCSMFHIYDDGFQARHDLSQVEIGYCYAVGCCPWGGMGESGTDGDDPDPGNWFIHHNVVDIREERGSDWRTQPHPHYPAIPHSPDGDSPRKFYNNLLLYGPDCEEESGPGFAHCGAEPAQNNATAFCHEIFNNIVIRQSWSRPNGSSERYDPTFIIAPGSFGYSRLFRNRTDYVMERVNFDANQSNELWDYNLYYKAVQDPVDGLLRKYRRGQTAGPDLSFAELDAWHASTSFTLSKAAGSRRGAYPDGFEGNSTDSKPVLATLDNFPAERFTGYRPSATAAVTVAASGSLSGEDWYGAGNLPDWGDAYFPWNDGERTLAPSPWKGALDPNGSTLPVGAQNT